MRIFKVTATFYVIAENKQQAERIMVGYGEIFPNCVEAEDVTALPSVEDEQDYRDNDLNF